ncbi:MAG: PilZ domain-containing protein [Spirochaetales bacterium]|nr:PilZ domain-containing protein [Spirochaetales bacterium]
MDTQPSVYEARQHPRYRVLAMIRLDFGQEESLTAETLNYSTSGILCRLDVSLPPGSRVTILLEFEGVPLAVDAVSVRQTQTESGYEVGLQMLELAGEAHQKLIEFFEQAS